MTRRLPGPDVDQGLGWMGQLLSRSAIGILHISQLSSIESANGCRADATLGHASKHTLPRMLSLHDSPSPLPPDLSRLQQLRKEQAEADAAKEAAWRQLKQVRSCRVQLNTMTAVFPVGFVHMA